MDDNYERVTKLSKLNKVQLVHLILRYSYQNEIKDKEIYNLKKKLLDLKNKLNN